MKVVLCSFVQTSTSVTLVHTIAVVMHFVLTMMVATYAVVYLAMKEMDTPVPVSYTYVHAYVVCRYDLKITCLILFQLMYLLSLHCSSVFCLAVSLINILTYVCM